MFHYDFLDIQNHRIERMWPEVNQRVNYRIKNALIEMVDADQLNMDDDLVRFCTSELCVQLSELGIKRSVDAWHAQRIPGNTKVRIVIL